MDKAHVEPTLHHDYKLQRLIVLTDAVFAIAMTLLALELRPPETWDGSIAGLFGAMRVSLVAYAVSFFVVAGYWASHRRVFGFILKADGLLTMFSLLALGLVTLLPIVTRFMTEHGGNHTALSVYLGLFAAIGLANTVVWGYACLKPGLIDPAVDKRARIFYLLLQLWPSLTCSAVIFITAADAVWRWLLMLPLILAAFAFRRWRGKIGEPKPAPARPAVTRRSARR
jgi:uncharacterized membrane protein